MLLVIVLFIAFTAWVFIEYYARVLLSIILSALGVKLGVYWGVFAILIAYSGYIWFPWMSILLLRDHWLHRSIQRQLRGALCKECEYSLLGLEAVIDQDTWKYVVCPECGTKNEFQSGVLNPADIDLALLVKSES